MKQIQLTRPLFVRWPVGKGFETVVLFRDRQVIRVRGAAN
jgi:hypothetical protein